MPFLPKKNGGDGVNLLRTLSAQKRISNDQEILQNLKGVQWLIGQGLLIPARNRSVSKIIPSHSHFADNLLVFLLSNIGLIGTSTLLILALKCLAKNNGENKNKIILLTSLISHGMFNNNFTQSFVVLIFLGFYLTKD